MDYFELDCLVEPREPFADVLMAGLASIGFDMFEEHDKGVKAYIKADQFHEEDLDSVDYFKPNEFCTVTWSVRHIPGKNWNEEWERNFNPVVIDDKVLVRAAFHPAQPAYPYEIVIQPKMSFGTGHHETTSLMMSRMLKIDFMGKAVLDMGCGSGILAILAGMIGAKEITAVDYDPMATSNAEENCKINNFPFVSVKTGSVEVIADQQFDIILANINRNILLEQIPVYARCLKYTGILLLSGFYENDITALLDLAQRFEMKCMDQSLMNRWCELMLVKVE